MMAIVRRRLALLVLLAGCSSESMPIDPARDAGVAGRDGGPSEARDVGSVGRDGGAIAVDYVPVSHDRELRGVWIASVANINFPSRTGLAPEQLRAELDAIVSLVASVGLNAIFFQVRPESDALYESTLEPWSRFLTGTQGGDPGMDPLRYLLDEAHRYGIEVHAWLNPYRAKSSRSSSAVAPHISVVAPEHAHAYGNLLWMDPAADVVRERTLAVVTDIVERYDVDGLHFDDYFYPYPDGTQFPDDTTYADYVMGGGALGRDDWRRDNVHRLVEGVADVMRRHPDVRFGISPFGIYRPGMPEGITGLDQYAEIYADPVRWMDEGWVDYLAPQLYWPSTQTRQAYEPLLEWWAALTRDGRSIFAGNYLSQLGSSAAWDLDEVRTQIDITRRNRTDGALGNIYFHIGPLEEDRDSVATVFAEEIYPRPALSPVLAVSPNGILDPPVVQVMGPELVVSHDEPQIFGWVIYRESDGDHVVERIAGPEERIVLSAGTYVISAADRYRRESVGVRVVVD